MRSSRKSLTLLAAAGAIGVPAAQAQSQEPAVPALDPPGAHAAALAQEATGAVRDRLVRHVLRRERKVAALQGRKLRPGYRRALRTLATEDLVERRRDAKRALRRARRKATERERGGTGLMPAHLAAIAQCESGGNPAAIGGGGTYRGLFQFDRATWAGVGGSGDPAAASVSEQVKRAQILFSRAGSSPWPVCG